MLENFRLLDAMQSLVYRLLFRTSMRVSVRNNRSLAERLSVLGATCYILIRHTYNMLSRLLYRNVYMNSQLICSLIIYFFLQGWKNEPVKPGMSVSHVGKRLRPFHHWEPIYIGTNQATSPIIEMLIKLRTLDNYWIGTYYLYSL